jgi:hypothetical protein
VPGSTNASEGQLHIRKAAHTPSKAIKVNATDHCLDAMAKRVPAPNIAEDATSANGSESQKGEKDHEP